MLYKCKHINAANSRLLFDHRRTKLPIISTINKIPISMIPVDEGLYKKLAVLYPSLNEDELRLICKKNYNNELAVMGDLSARGYRPAVAPGNDARSMYTVIQSAQSRNYTPLPYTGHIASTSIPTTLMTTSTTTSTAMTTTTNASGNGTSSSITAIKTINTDITKAHDKNPALIAAKVSNSSPTPALAISSTTDGCNSPQSYWCINTAKRTYSPIVGKMNPARQTTNAPVSHYHATTTTEKQNGSTTNTKTTGRYYYPGRFVQGVGFEPNSMGGAPRITGKPFVPLQGRYVFSGMINDRSYSPKLPQAKPPNTRDPNYGSGHQNHDLYQPTISPPPPPNPPPISLAVYAAYARQAEAAGFGNTNLGNNSPHQRSPAHSPYPTATPSINYGTTYSHVNSASPYVTANNSTYGVAPRPYAGPIPSWYGEEDRIQVPVQRLHHDLIKNRITDRSASPPTSTSILRTYSPVFGLRDRPIPSPSPVPQQQTSSSTPYHHYYPSYSHHLATTTTSGSSFYATASRLYTQSPKPTLRSTTTPVAVPSTSSSISHPQPYPHYHGPSTRPSPPPTALVVSTTNLSNYNSPCHSPAFYPGRISSPTLIQTAVNPDGYPPYPAARTSQTAGPHSPKIKLRYLRRIYPGVDETILLDVLANADNNVQTAMQELATLGYVKIETPPIRPASAQTSTQSGTLLKAVDAFQTKAKTTDRDQNKPVAPPRRLTEADKQKTRARMLEKVKEVPADILTIALESVNFDEDKALVLLNLIMKEESKKESDKSCEDKSTENSTGLLANLENNRIAYGTTKPIVPARSNHKLITDQAEKIEREDYVFRSRYKSDIRGPNSSLRRGPNPELLQKDPNSVIKTSTIGMSKGPNRELLHSQSNNENSILNIPSIKEKICYNESSAVKIITRDSSPNLHKGPQHCLVQGSTYKIPS